MANALITGKQFTSLFDIFSTLDNSASDVGCDGDLTVVSALALKALGQEFKRLKEMELSLKIGVHTHRHGDSLYAFAVQGGASINFVDHLEDDFEEDRDESLSLVDGGTIELVGTRDVNLEGADGEERSELIDTQAWAAHNYGLEIGLLDPQQQSEWVADYRAALDAE